MLCPSLAEVERDVCMIGIGRPIGLASEIVVGTIRLESLRVEVDFFFSTDCDRVDPFQMVTVIAS
jgi:hypothetical protein